MPLSPRRKVTTPKKKFHVRFTGIQVTDIHTGETVLDARTPEMVSLITKNLGMSSEAVAERDPQPKGTAA